MTIEAIDSASTPPGTEGSMELRTGSRRTRVLMVATSYPADFKDWRGLFIRHMAEALARREDTQLRLWAPPGQLPERASSAATSAEARWLEQLMKAGGIAHLMRTKGLRGLPAPVQLLRMLRLMYLRNEAIDVYHVNWLQNALVLPRNTIPLLVSVLGTDLQLLRLPGMVTLLRRVLRCRRSVICPNASWMVADLEARFGDVAAIRFLPFGIDKAWFAIERKMAVPERWLCVSRLTNGKIGKLFEWGREHFLDGQRELHLFGPMQQSMNVPDWVHYHGPATPESLYREWFPTAQGLISLSQHAEGRPQVMLEAMAAGLPIVASRIPAHEDLLIHGQSGWLCSTSSDLCVALTELSNRAYNNEVGHHAREIAAQEIGTWDDCASRYACTYAELMESRSGIP